MEGKISLLPLTEKRCEETATTTMDRSEVLKQTFFAGKHDREAGRPITCVEWDPEGNDGELNDIYMTGYDPYGEIVERLDGESPQYENKKVWQSYGCNFPSFKSLRRTCTCHWYHW